MLEEVLQYLHNWFCSRKEFGTFRIEGGYIDLPFAKDGQFFRIIGSDLNDGIYQFPETNLNDEVFKGSVWMLAIPAPVLELAEEIAEWQEKNADTIQSPYQSESFGGYSYSKASSSSSDTTGSSGVTWMDAFGARLVGWRKI